VHAAINGPAWAAAGIAIGVVLRMLRRPKPSWYTILFGSIAFVAVGILQLSLIAVALTTALVSVAVTFTRRRS
jgi:hypothetical protein